MFGIIILFLGYQKVSNLTFLYLINSAILKHDTCFIKMLK